MTVLGGEKGAQLSGRRRGEGLEVMALIPARGGSTRVPGKNLRRLGGRPLIAWSIACAQRSRYIRRVIVSTDSDEIAAVSRRAGAEVPFRRPAEISGPHSGELEVFEHALGWLAEHEGYEPDVIVKLLPTSPFRRSRSVDEAVELLLAHPEADSVRSVRLCSEHPCKMWRIEGGRLVSLLPEGGGLKPREGHNLAYQLLPRVYVQNASFDVTRPGTIRRYGSISGRHILPYVMGPEESVDINEPLDLVLAEALVRKGRHHARGGAEERELRFHRAISEREAGLPDLWRPGA